MVPCSGNWSCTFWFFSHYHHQNYYFIIIIIIISLFVLCCPIWDFPLGHSGHVRLGEPAATEGRPSLLFNGWLWTRRGVHHPEGKSGYCSKRDLNSQPFIPESRVLLITLSPSRHLLTLRFVLSRDPRPKFVWLVLEPPFKEKIQQTNRLLYSNEANVD